ncbi:MAG: rod shape-determining protein MreD [Candidatus Omnitrophota bacterium]
MYKIRFKTVRFVIIALLSLVFQTTLINIISLGVIKPDLILLLVIFFGLYNGIYRGVFCGIILGFCVDSLSGGILGINSIILGAVGMMTGLLEDRVYRTHFLTKILVPFSGSIFSVTAYYILAGNFYGLPAFSEHIGVIAGSVLYTTFLSLVFFNFLEKQTVLKQYTLQRN